MLDKVQTWSEPASKELFRVELELATPMLGGGATPGKVDSHYPIRASAVRGMLRHWWRASVGSTCATAEDMQRRENKIFGAMAKRENEPLPRDSEEKRPKDTSGKIRVDVSNVELGSIGLLNDCAAPDYAWGLYAEHASQLQVLKTAKFQLTIAEVQELTQDQRKEVVRSTLFWIAFGGLGSRTRRGFGSLAFKPIEAPRLKASSRSVEVGEFNLGAYRMLVSPKRSSANAAWKESIDLYGAYRTAKIIRRPRPDPFGRLASRVVLKPYQTDDGWRGLCLITDRPYPGPSDVDKDRKPTWSYFDGADRNGNDACDAFANFLITKGWKAN